MEWLAKVLPTFAVAAVLGYCCWSEEELPPAAAAAGKKAAPAAGVLSPTPPPPPDRDPFVTPGAQAGAGKPLATKEAAGKQAAGTSRESTPAPAQRHADGLVLRGTYLRAERRLALINERFYAEGQTLPAGKNAETGLLVTRIEADRVLLQASGETVELKYRLRDAKAGAKAAPATKTATKE